MHYWSNVKKVLEKTIGAEYIITGVPGLVSMSFILTNEVQWQLHLGLALWLLETHETEVTDSTGMCNIPNFIFGGIKLVYKKDKSLDTKVCASMFKFSSLILSCGAIA